MFPVLVLVYRRLAVAEEREMTASFGPAWGEYAAGTPRFIPAGSLSPAQGGRRAAPRAGRGLIGTADAPENEAEELST